MNMQRQFIGETTKDNKNTNQLVDGAEATRSAVDIETDLIGQDVNLSRNLETTGSNEPHVGGIMVKNIDSPNFKTPYNVQFIANIECSSWSKAQFDYIDEMAHNYGLKVLIRSKSYINRMYNRKLQKCFDLRSLIFGRKILTIYRIVLNNAEMEYSFLNSLETNIVLTTRYLKDQNKMDVQFARVRSLAEASRHLEQIPEKFLTRTQSDVGFSFSKLGSYGFSDNNSLQFLVLATKIRDSGLMLSGDGQLSHFRPRNSGEITSSTLVSL